MTNRTYGQLGTRKVGRLMRAVGLLFSMAIATALPRLAPAAEASASVAAGYYHPVGGSGGPTVSLGASWVLWTPTERFRVAWSPELEYLQAAGLDVADARARESWLSSRSLGLRPLAATLRFGTHWQPWVQIGLPFRYFFSNRILTGNVERDLCPRSRPCWLDASPKRIWTVALEPGLGLDMPLKHMRLSIMARYSRLWSLSDTDLGAELRSDDRPMPELTELDTELQTHAVWLGVGLGWAWGRTAPQHPSPARQRPNEHGEPEEQPAEPARTPSPAPDPGEAPKPGPPPRPPGEEPRAAPKPVDALCDSRCAAWASRLSVSDDLYWAAEAKCINLCRTHPSPGGFLNCLESTQLPLRLLDRCANP